jgi:glycogen operon protein
MNRTQLGNNNAYCQDNEISWFDWDSAKVDTELFDFTRGLISMFRSNPILRRRDFFTGKPAPNTRSKDVTWIRDDGQEMSEDDWADPGRRTIGMLLLGRAADEIDHRGRLARGDTLLLLLNAGLRSRPYALPPMEWPGRWQELVDTARPEPRRRTAGEIVHLSAHSAVVLRHQERLEA